VSLGNDRVASVRSRAEAAAKSRADRPGVAPKSITLVVYGDVPPRCGRTRYWDAPKNDLSVCIAAHRGQMLTSFFVASLPWACPFAVAHWPLVLQEHELCDRTVLGARATDEVPTRLELLALRYLCTTCDATFTVVLVDVIPREQITTERLL
jgi:hypothetical protein